MVRDTELTEFLKTHPPAAHFVPYCHLSEASDSLTVYFEGDPDYSERLSEHVTVFRSLTTSDVVGCRIKGIAGILEDLPNYIHVNHDGIELSLIFLAFRGGSDEQHVTDAINQLARAATKKKMTLPATAS